MKITKPEEVSDFQNEDEKWLHENNVKLRMRKYRYIDVPVLVLGNNQMFGLIDFLKKQPHSYTAVCGENTYLYEIAQDNLEKKLVVYTEIRKFLIRLTKKRIRKIKRYIEEY